MTSELREPIQLTIMNALMRLHDDDVIRNDCPAGTTIQVTGVSLLDASNKDELLETYTSRDFDTWVHYREPDGGRYWANLREFTPSEAMLIVTEVSRQVF